ncbi:MAG: major capsid protein [Solirubrobacteraceae bacterium]
MKPGTLEKLGRIKELNDDELDELHLQLIGELSGLEAQDSAQAIGELQALQLAASAVDRAFGTRQALAASAAPAASGAVARMAARQGGHPAPSPEVRAQRSRAVLLATGNLRGVDPSTPITDRWQFARALADTLSGMDRHGPPRGAVLVASARYEYPPERRLTGQQEQDAQLMDAVTSPQALVATGGICLPVNVDFGVPTWATADRPLRDGLPSFEASRGGLRYVQAPDIGAWAAATAIWTEATDAAPGAATKPVVSLQCGGEQLVYVDAVPTRLGFGNMQSRFAPEQVAANTDLAMAAAARIAENNLLNHIAAASVLNVTTAQLLGAARDVITTLNQSVAAYRNAHRIPDTQMITAIFPAWLKQLIKVDLAREIGHGQSNDWNVLAITDQQVDDLMIAAGVKPIWHLDGQPNSVSGGVAQTFAIQGTGAILTFPTKLVFYLFVEGSIQFLDGGRLDLGVVRDSTLNATNDMEVMIETFEAVAYRGFTAGAIQYVSTLCANGASTGTIAPVTCA